MGQRRNFFGSVGEVSVSRLIGDQSPFGEKENGTGQVCAISAIASTSRYDESMLEAEELKSAR